MDLAREALSVEDQLALLTEASAMLLASPESPAVLQTILDLSKRFIQADAYSVWRKKPEKNIWEVMASEGLSDRYARVIAANPVEEAKMPRDPVIVENLNATPFAHRIEAYRAEGIRSLIAVPLRIHGEFAGSIVFYYRSRHCFPEMEMRVAGALGNLAAAALGAAELYERQQDLRRRAEEQEHKASFLAEAGRVLLGSLDYERTLAAVAELAVPAFADWACVDILDAAGDVRRVAQKHTDPEKIRINEELRRKFPPFESDLPRKTLRTGRSILIEEISEKLIERYGRSQEHVELFLKLGIRSVILAPLVANERSFGMLMFATVDSGRRYSSADFALAQELARRAALAVENARLYAESQNARQALGRANEDLHQFAYSVSHDLREPLRMLAAYSQMLQRNCASALNAEAKEYLGFIAEGAVRMDELLADLLAYIRAADAVPAVAEPVPASEVLGKAIANLSSAIRDSEAQISAEPLPRLLVEEIHLLQLFQNLLGNAMKYRGESAPEIRVWAASQGAYCKISVEDNGIGIPRKYSEQIFGVFKRLHSRAEYPGTGIGLSICQKIVERYGGHIWVESEPGKGSTFCFTLPAEACAS